MVPTRVLLVDDSNAQRHMIRHRLAAAEGVEVVGEASNGREALYEFSALKPDVVLLDLVMPEMSGEDVLQAILQMDPNANVVIISSLGTGDAIERCLKGGARSFLQKPFDTPDLVRTLSSLERKHAS